jgi:phage shock protein PspC (stress-responsive transcriptional regulator)
LEVGLKLTIRLLKVLAVFAGATLFYLAFHYILAEFPGVVFWWTELPRWIRVGIVLFGSLALIWGFMAYCVVTAPYMDEPKDKAPK